MNDEVSPPRPGSTQDLSRRMDKIEQKQDDQARDLTSLTGTVARMEMNQAHQAELNKLRFDSLDTGIGGVKASLEQFMGRINGIITGEVRLPQIAERTEEWEAWRKEVDAERRQQATLNTQIRFTGTLGKVLITSNIVSWVIAIVALLN